MAFGFMQLCSWPDEVFLLLVYESRGKRDGVLGMLNQDQELELLLALGGKKKPFWHIHFCCLLWIKAPFIDAQGVINLSNPCALGLVWPALSSLMLLLLELWQSVGSPSCALAPLCSLSFPLSRSHQLSGRRIASSQPQTTRSFGCSIAAHVLSSPFNQGEEWQIAGWEYPSGCWLMIAINSDNNNSNHK